MNEKNTNEIENLSNANHQLILTLALYLSTVGPCVNRINALANMLDKDFSLTNAVTVVKGMRDTAELLKQLIQFSPNIHDILLKSPKANSLYDNIRKSNPNFKDKTNKEIADILKSEEYLSGLTNI